MLANFRQYISNKPNKYEIKIYALCDLKVFYTSNMLANNSLVFYLRVVYIVMILLIVKQVNQTSKLGTTKVKEG